MTAFESTCGFGFMNGEAELEVPATASVSPLFPRSGTLMLGEAGIEFRSRGGRGFVQVPWGKVSRVRVDAYGSRARGVEVVLSDGRCIPFVMTGGNAVVRSIVAHLGRERVVPAHRPLLALVRRALRRSLPSRGQRAGDDVHVL